MEVLKKVRYSLIACFILTLILILSGTGIFCGSTQAKGSPELFKMAFISDTHLSFEKKNDWFLSNESLVIFQDAIRGLNKGSGLDFIVFGGDLIDNTDKQFSDLATFTDTIGELTVPYYVIPGDREADLAEDYDKQNFAAEFRKNGPKEDLYWAVESVKGVLLIGLDTTMLNKRSGELPQEQLSWLDCILKSNQDKFTVITMHHSAISALDQNKKQFEQDFVLSNSSEFLNLIKKYPQVKLVLSGHHHTNLARKIGSTVFISSPSIVTYPNYFKILTVYSDRIEVKNQPISYKQIISKAKRAIIDSKYAKDFSPKHPKEILELQEGDDYSNKKVFYFNAD